MELQRSGWRRELKSCQDSQGSDQVGLYLEDSGKAEVYLKTNMGGLINICKIGKGSRREREWIDDTKWEATALVELRWQYS